MLIPGLAGSFLLLFVESLADLGNPLFIAGNTTVLSAQIFIAINGEYDQQKGAALALVLLLPTLTVFLLQRYWVSRRSYVTVTGKPSGRTLPATVWYMRWPCILATYGVMFLIFTLYMTIVVGSFTRLWGVDYTPDWRHYATAMTRGIEAFMDTTFLSAVATPLAGVAGMMIAYLVVRKTFSGKEGLDFVSNLGGAVPGTILGIGYILAFIQAPLMVVGLVYVLLVGYLAAAALAPAVYPGAYCHELRTCLRPGAAGSSRHAVHHHHGLRGAQLTGLGACRDSGAAANRPGYRGSLDQPRG